MTRQVIGIFGGGGFVGHHLASQLSSQGHQVKVFSRHPQRIRGLTVSPTVSLAKVDFTKPASLTEALAGCDVCINLIGILNESGHSGKGFREAHINLTKKIVEACKSQGVRRYLHMSALGANQAKAPSHYLRTKGEAEDWVHQQERDDFKVTSFRPSVIFGEGDTFLNQFALLLRLAPGLMLLPCAASVMSPIFVGDVVQVMARSINDRRCYSQRYDLCGPAQYSLLSLVELLAQTAGHRVKVIGLGGRFTYLMATIMEYLPGKLLSRDNYWSSTLPGVCLHPLPEFLSDGERLAVETYMIQWFGSENKHDALNRYRQLVKR